METVSAGDARLNLSELIEQVAQQHRPIEITGETGRAVLISSKDYSALLETLHLMGIPGMAQSIVEGLHSPIEECSTNIDLDGEHLIQRSPEDRQRLLDDFHDT